MSELPVEIAERYGKGPEALRRRRLGVIVAASTFALLFVVWLIWAGLTGVSKPVFKTTAFELIGTNQIKVTMLVSKPQNSNVECSVQALKADYGIVAYKQVTITGDKSSTGSIEDVSKVVLLRTTEQAVTGLVDDCWFY